MRSLDGIKLSARSLATPSPATPDYPMCIYLVGSLILLRGFESLVVLDSALQLLVEICSVKTVYMGSFSWAPLTPCVLLQSTVESITCDESSWLALNCQPIHSIGGQLLKCYSSVNETGKLYTSIFLIFKKAGTLCCYKYSRLINLVFNSFIRPVSK